MSQAIIHAEPPYVLGADVGGSKVAAGLVDSAGRLFGQIRNPTDVTSPEATLDVIAKTVNQVILKAGIARNLVQAIGVGVPGLIDPEHGIGIASVNLNWRNVPVRAELETRLHLPVEIENDVKAAALGESRYGTGKGMRHLILLTIGTGVAAGVILNGKIYRGPNGMAGEIGHAVIDLKGPICKCGGHGCLEAIASGPAIAARAANKIQTGRSSILRTVTANETEKLNTEMVFEAATHGDEIALETIQEVSQYIAIAIQFLSLAYDPNIVILGGGVPQAGKPFLEPLMQSLQTLAEENWVFGKIYTPEFVQVTKWGADIGILGAAALVASS